MEINYERQRRRQLDVVTRRVGPDVQAGTQRLRRRRSVPFRHHWKPGEHCCAWSRSVDTTNYWFVVASSRCHRHRLPGVLPVHPNRQDDMRFDRLGSSVPLSSGAVLGALHVASRVHCADWKRMDAGRHNGRQIRRHLSAIACRTIQVNHAKVQILNMTIQMFHATFDW